MEDKLRVLHARSLELETQLQVEARSRRSAEEANRDLVTSAENARQNLRELQGKVRHGHHAGRRLPRVCPSWSTCIIRVLRKTRGRKCCIISISKRRSGESIARSDEKIHQNEKTKTKTGTCVMSNRHRGGLFVFETSNMLRGSDPVLITFFLLICVSSYYCVEHHNQACKFLQRSDLFGLGDQANRRCRSGG